LPMAFFAVVPAGPNQRKKDRGPGFVLSPPAGPAARPSQKTKFWWVPPFEKAAVAWVPAFNLKFLPTGPKSGVKYNS